MCTFDALFLRIHTNQRNSRYFVMPLKKYGAIGGGGFFVNVARDTYGSVSMIHGVTFTNLTPSFKIYKLVFSGMTVDQLCKVSGAT